MPVFVFHCETMWCSQKTNRYTDVSVCTESSGTWNEDRSVQCVYMFIFFNLDNFFLFDSSNTSRYKSNRYILKYCPLRSHWGWNLLFTTSLHSRILKIFTYLIKTKHNVSFSCGGLLCYPLCGFAHRSETFLLKLFHRAACSDLQWWEQVWLNI